jgi:hypothetical protein
VSLTTEAQMEGARMRLPLAAEALLLPDSGMRRAAKMGRVRWALAFVTACSLALGVAQSLNVDARESTLRELDQQGKLATMSDRQIDDAQKQSERSFIAKRSAQRVVFPPLGILFTGLGLFALSWFLRGRSEAGQIFVVAAYSKIPSAFAYLLEMSATLLRGRLSPDSPPLLPSNFGDIATAFGLHLAGPLAKVLGAFDVFDLWGAVLVGFGLAAAAQLPTRRALTGTLIAWVCYRLVRFVVLGG